MRTIIFSRTAGMAPAGAGKTMLHTGARDQLPFFGVKSTTIYPRTWGRCRLTPKKLGCTTGTHRQHPFRYKARDYFFAYSGDGAGWRRKSKAALLVHAGSIHFGVKRTTIYPRTAGMAPAGAGKTLFS